MGHRNQARGCQRASSWLTHLSKEWGALEARQGSLGLGPVAGMQSTLEHDLVPEPGGSPSLSPIPPQLLNPSTHLCLALREDPTCTSLALR